MLKDDQEVEGWPTGYDVASEGSEGQPEIWRADRFAATSNVVKKTKDARREKQSEMLGSNDKTVN